MSEKRKICTFYLDKYFFGIDVSQIQEVIRHHELTAVPLADETISGLINLRGQIVTAIDMRKRLNFSKIHENQKPTNIIVRTDDGAVSLWVDDIGDVIDLPIDTFEARPENLESVIKSVLKEIYKFEDKLLLILDIGQILTLS